MARKLPPPIIQQQSPSNERHNVRTESRQPQESSAEDHRGHETENDSVSPLPSPNLGAVPRSPHHRSSQDPNCIRRRLESLNLESPRLSPTNGRNVFQFPPSNPAAGSYEVTALEGQELYLHFFHEQLRSAQLGDFATQEEARLTDYHLAEAHMRDDVPMRRRTISLNLENFQNPIWRETGRELQSLADSFASSSERIQVRERAQQVDIMTITKEKFLAMLSELFQGGRITRERILVLFFFCSDIAILAVRSRISGLLADLTKWSLQFIRDQVCAWVHQNGGWSAVLSSGLNFLQQAAIIGMCSAVMACCFIYIRKNLS